MNKIKIWISNYFKKSSWYKIAGDLLFYIFIILMIIPTTRREISAFIIRATLRKPAVEETAVKKLNPSDYQMTIEDLQGNMLSLDQFDGEIILLNFWATWCPPCRAEMPSMQELYNDYGDKISFVLVSSEEKSKITQYFNEFGYNMPVYIQRSPLPPAFPVQSIPTTYLINRKGEVIVEKNGAANWNSDKFRSRLDEMIGS